MGGRHDSRTFPRSQLRQLGFRGHPLLLHARRSGGFPAARARPPHDRFGQDLPHGEPRLLGRATRRGDAGTGARQQDGRLLHPPDRVPRLRRDRRQSAEESHRRLHRLLGVGQVSGRRSAGRRRGRLRFELDPHGAEHPARAGQGRRQLHELAAHQDGSHHQRLQPRASRSTPTATSARARARTSSWSATARSTRRRSAPPCCPASRATAS